jgi:hypothetical protein
MVVKHSEVKKQLDGLSARSNASSVIDTDHDDLISVDEMLATLEERNSLVPRALLDQIFRDIAGADGWVGSKQWLNSH